MKIDLVDICKYYGPVKAGEKITITFEPGLIYGILGENGAGKSTLMKILSGYTEKTSGQIFIDQNPVQFHSPADATRLGIGMLYQDPLDFSNMKVLENFVTGQQAALFKKEDFRKRFFEISQIFEFGLNPDSRLAGLTIGERQQLEIMRLFALGISVWILDEPTTGISSFQKKRLFDTLKKLVAENKTVILVSHKLEDVETLCDRVAVLRQGQITGKMDRPFDTTRLLEMMFGALPPPPVRLTVEKGENVMEVEDICSSGGRTGLKPCTVTIREGEVIGLAGLEGSGQETFLRTAAGLKKLLDGKIRLKQTDLTGSVYHDFMEKGVFFLPSSRLEEGLIPGLTIAEHVVLEEGESGFFIRSQRAEEIANRKIENYRIAGTPRSRVESLSGGNQQRLLLSLLKEKPQVLLLENPTRGLDLESTLWVWQQLYSLCAKKTAIVFTSPELDEIMMFAARVLVFFEGEIIMDVRAEKTDVNELGKAIAGKID